MRQVEGRKQVSTVVHVIEFEREHERVCVIKS